MENRNQNQKQNQKQNQQNQQQRQQQTYRQDSAFHPIHLSIFDPAAMPTHAKYRISTGSGHGRSRTPHMDTVDGLSKETSMP